MKYSNKLLDFGLRFSKKSPISLVLSLSLMVFSSLVDYAAGNQAENGIIYPLENLKGVDVDKFLIENNVCALLVSHNGVIKIAKYHPHAAELCDLPENRCTEKPDVKNTEYGLASMTKSINSTLLGLLIHKTGTPNINDTIESIFPDFDLRKGGYGCRTVKDVLLMSGGIDWSKKKSDMVGDRMRSTVHNNGGNVTFLNFIQEVTKKEKCKKRSRNEYAYQAIDSIMLGLVTQKYIEDQSDLLSRSGAHISSLPDAYIEWLWKELKMTGSVKWNGEHQWKGRKCPGDNDWQWKIPDDGIAPKGMVATDCCMYAHPSDLIKFGKYILDNYQATSNSDEYPIRDWVHASAENAVSTSTFPNCWFPTVYKDYGYQWWHLGDKDRNYDEMGFSAIGRGGQFVRIIPKDNTVVVQFSSSKKNTVESIQCKSFRFHKKIITALNKTY